LEPGGNHKQYHSCALYKTKVHNGHVRIVLNFVFLSFEFFRVSGHREAIESKLLCFRPYVTKELCDAAKRIFVLRIFLLLLSLIILLTPSPVSCKETEKPEKPAQEKTWDYWYRLGKLKFRQKELDKAAQALERAVKAAENPADKSRAHELLSHLYREKGDTVKFISNLEKAAHLSPEKYALFTYRIVNHLMEDGKPEEAETRARAAMKKIKTDKGRLMLWERICAIHKNGETFENLKKECAPEKKTGYRTPEQIKKLITIYNIEGDRKKVAQLYAQLTQADPADREARKRLADMLLSQGKGLEAAKLLEEFATGISENRNQYAEMLIEIYLEHGEKKKAEKWMEFLRRPSASGSLRLARILEKAGDREGALREYSSAKNNANTIHEYTRAVQGKIKLLEKMKQYMKGHIECLSLMSNPSVPKQVREQAKEADTRFVEKLKDLQKKNKT